MQLRLVVGAVYLPEELEAGDSPKGLCGFNAVGPNVCRIPVEEGDELPVAERQLRQRGHSLIDPSLIIFIIACKRFL